MRKLFLLVGPSGSGKTYLITRLLAEYPTLFAIVRSTTSRPWREKDDNAAYIFVTEQEFRGLIENKGLLEHDAYLGHFYGLETREIENVLSTHHGLKAITPKGAIAVQEGMPHLPQVTIVLSASPEVLRKNLERRGVEDEEAIGVKMRHSSDFVLPENRVCYRLEMRGDESDFPRFEEIIRKEVAALPKEE